MPLRLAESVAGVVLQQRLPQRRVGGALEPAVDGRPDLVPGGVGVFPVRPFHVRAHHFREVGRLDLDGESVDLRGHRRIARGVVLVLLDVAEFQHAPEHVVPAHDRLLRVGDGVEPRRRLGQTRDHGELGKRELRDRAPVVDLRRGPDPVGALAEEDLVDVELQDLLLGELALDLQREEDLVELADVRLLAGEEEVPGHLHGDGAAPRPLLPGADEVQHGAGQTLPVDPGMLEEPVVLAGEERLDEPIRNLVEMKRRAALLAELRHELVVTGVDAQRHLQPDIAQRLRGGELRLQVPVGAARPDGHGEHRQQHEDAESLQCAGESNHGLSLRGPAAERPSTAHRPRGSTVSGWSIRRWVWGAITGAPSGERISNAPEGTPCGPEPPAPVAPVDESRYHRAAPISP